MTAWWLTSTAIVKTVVATAQPKLFATYDSPNGQWRAEVVRYDCADYNFQEHADLVAYEQLKIIHRSDGTEEIVDAQLQNCGGIGKYGLDGLYWSPNSRYFYYTGSREGYPETCGEYWVDSIYRVDVLSQRAGLIGSGHLSPDKSKLAFWQNNELVFLNIDDGELGRIPALIPDAMLGDISWSPDGRALVYLQTTQYCGPDYGSTYIIQVSFPSLAQSLLFEQASPGFGQLDWERTDLIILTDGNLKEWEYGLVSKELKSVP